MTKPRMKRKNIKALADFIEGGSHPWNISDCHTCFMGQLRAMTGGSEFGVADFLGIDDDALGGPLIMPPGWYPDSSESRKIYSRERAVEVLRALPKSKSVNWS